MRYEPVPAPDQLAQLSSVLGFTVTWQRRIRGGLGCTTDALEGDGRQLVLRRHGPWWIDQDPPVALKEKEVLELLSSRGIPVPEPLWAEKSGVFPGPAMVITWIEGSDTLIPVDPLSAARQLAETLAAIHSVEVDSVLRSRIASDTFVDGDRPAGYADHPLAAAVEERLASLKPTDPGSTLVHGDYWPGNTIWRDGALVAVIDWEECTVGDPMNDVAYCATDLRYLGLDHAADVFIDDYRNITGHPMDTLPYWTLFAMSRPMPDIAQWLPAWEAKGITHISADELRARHRELLEEALG